MFSKLSSATNPVEVSARFTAEETCTGGGAVAFVCDIKVGTGIGVFKLAWVANEHELF